MLCQICNENEATVEFTQIINNEVTQLHLCGKCAKTKGIEMEQHFSIADFLAGLSDFGIESHPEDILIKCPKCGMTFEDFKKVGRFGCSDCYVKFKKNLLPLFKRIHGSTRHLGKATMKLEKAAGTEKRSQSQELRQKLQRAVDAEEYEEAAKIRDTIRELEKKIRQGQ